MGPPRPVTVVEAVSARFGGLRTEGPLADMQFLGAELVRHVGLRQYIGCPQDTRNWQDEATASLWPRKGVD